MSQTESDSWDLTDEEYEALVEENYFSKKEDPGNSGCFKVIIVVIIIIIIMAIFKSLRISSNIPMK
ncbi:hypothetical protein [Flavobacterium saccharophilum]|uniref:Uncharacterized protein n=1 Tax=Flavobacterium saccharophilum TaxID=29534 RepID=A0A1M6Z4Z0_9FLAO|nr:hypothetical protein [Flavobacterium saccharophilum]SHL25616.1 hypothetical protein SAMN05444366_0124 [Flavobacterium saccharophilum]